MQLDLVATIKNASSRSSLKACECGVRYSRGGNCGYNDMAGYLPGGTCAHAWENADVQIIVHGKALTVVRGVDLIDGETNGCKAEASARQLGDGKP